MSNEHRFISYAPQHFSAPEMKERAKAYYAFMNQRRSVRFFSDEPVPFEVIADLVRTAGTAPSGAHRQPWTFCIVGNPEVKRRIREAAEKEEKESYEGRMGAQWLKDLEPLGTDWHKPFLEIAPWLVVVFKRPFEYEGESKHQNYYVNESVGIACGMLISAIHNAGLVTLTHTPSPMNFLSRILERPDNERAFLLLPIGYAASDAVVPDLRRKSFDELVKIFD